MAPAINVAQTPSTSFNEPMSSYNAATISHSLTTVGFSSLASSMKKVYSNKRKSSKSISPSDSPQPLSASSNTHPSTVVSYTVNSLDISSPIIADMAYIAQEKLRPSTSMNPAYYSHLHSPSHSHSHSSSHSHSHSHSYSRSPSYSGCHSHLHQPYPSYHNLPHKSNKSKLLQGFDLSSSNLPLSPPLMPSARTFHHLPSCRSDYPTYPASDNPVTPGFSSPKPSPARGSLDELGHFEYDENKKKSPNSSTSPQSLQSCSAFSADQASCTLNQQDYIAPLKVKSLKPLNSLSETMEQPSSLYNLARGPSCYSSPSLTSCTNDQAQFEQPPPRSPYMRQHPSAPVIPTIPQKASFRMAQNRVINNNPSFASMSSSSLPYVPPMKDIWLDDDSDGSSSSDTKSGTSKILGMTRKSSAKKSPFKLLDSKSKNQSSKRLEIKHTHLEGEATSYFPHPGITRYASSPSKINLDHASSNPLTPYVSPSKHNRTQSATNKFLHLLGSRSGVTRSNSVSSISSSTHSSPSKLKISAPTNFVHTGHIGPGDSKPINANTPAATTTTSPRRSRSLLSRSSSLLSIKGNSRSNSIKSQRHGHTPSNGSNVPSTPQTSSKPNQVSPLRPVHPSEYTRPSSMSPEKSSFPNQRNVEVPSHGRHQSSASFMHLRSPSGTTTGSNATTNTDGTNGTSLTQPPLYAPDSPPIPQKTAAHRFISRPQPLYFEEFRGGDGSTPPIPPRALNHKPSADSFTSWATPTADFVEQQRWLYQFVGACDTDTALVETESPGDSTNTSPRLRTQGFSNHRAGGGGQKIPGDINIDSWYGSGLNTPASQNFEDRRSMLLPSPLLPTSGNVSRLGGHTPTYGHVASVATPISHSTALGISMGDTMYNPPRREVLQHVKEESLGQEDSSQSQETPEHLRGAGRYLAPENELQWI